MNLELRYCPNIGCWCVYVDNRNVFIASSYQEARGYFVSVGGGVEIKDILLDNQLVEMMKRWNYHWSTTTDRGLFGKAEVCLS